MFSPLTGVTDWYQEPSACCLENFSGKSQDPYEAIRQAYLVGTNTESEPIEDPVETEAPESPHTVASPTLLPDGTPPTCHVEESEGSDTSSARSRSLNSTAPLSPDQLLTHTTPTLVPILRRTARMVVRVPPAMSPGLSASVVEVSAMSDLAFHKRFRSSYESLPSSSLPDLPSLKRYPGTSELVEDDDKEGDDEEEDEEMEESLDSDSISEDAEDEGPTTKDEDPAAGDKGLAPGDEGPGIGVKSLSLDRDEVVPGGQQRAGPVSKTAVGEPLGLGYGALRRREIALGEGRMPSVFEVGQSFGIILESERPEIVSALRQPTLTTWMDLEDGIVYMDVPAYPPPAPPAQTPPSPEWSFGSLPISPAPSIFSSPMISLTVPSPVASPVMVETEGFLTKFGTRVDIQGELIRDHTRPVLALESWAGQMDAHRAALWHAISDTQGENQELRLQFAEERCARLELAEIVDGIMRGQGPRGDV
ncbi:hypothetical protein Tco_0497590 [Tanacetum coccineum]